MFGGPELSYVEGEELKERDGCVALPYGIEKQQDSPLAFNGNTERKNKRRQED